MEARTITVLYDDVDDPETDSGAETAVYRQVAQALEERGHRVDVLAADPGIGKLVAQIEQSRGEVVFNLCESLGGEDRLAIHVASLLELLGKPFTGAGSVGLTLAQDKALAKKLFHFHGITYPRFSTMDAGHVEWSDQLKFPLFVKPLGMDSSVGIDAHAIVRNVKELMERLSYIHTEIGSPVLVEEFIEGREIYVGVIGNSKPEALPVLEWDFSKLEIDPKFATADAKWNKESEANKAPEVFPVDFPPPVYERIQQVAVETYRALKILDYARIDMRLRHKKKATEKAPKPGDDPDDWEIYVIEANPNPYLDARAEFAMAGLKAGWGYPVLVERIVELALNRQH